MLFIVVFFFVKNAVIISVELALLFTVIPASKTDSTPHLTNTGRQKSVFSKPYIHVHVGVDVCVQMYVCVRRCVRVGVVGQFYHYSVRIPFCRNFEQRHRLPWQPGPPSDHVARPTRMS